MVKTLVFIVFFTLFVTVVWPVRAISVGGQSALLSTSGASLQSTASSDKEREYQIKRKVIRKVLSSYNSPLADSTDAFINTCVKYNLDCYMLPSIAGLESFFGAHVYPNSNNPFGWGRGLIMFNTWDESIETVGQGIKTKYIDQGLESIDDIGRKYCENPTWASRVKSIAKKFEAEERKIRLFFPSNEVEL